MKYLAYAFLLVMNLSYADNLITKVDKSVVLVQSIIDAKNSGWGTGFVVANNGVIATNYHVVEDAKSIYLLTMAVGETPVEHQATILWVSPELDLALLSATSIKLAPLTLFNGVPEKGDQVFAIGFPGNANRNYAPDRLESTATQGIIGRYFESSLSDSNKKFGIVQHSAPINKGNSGGPLVDACGRVVGINTQITLGRVILDPKSGAHVLQSDGIGFAINASELVNALKAQNIIGLISSEACSTSSRALGQDADARTNWVFFFVLIGTLGLAGIALVIAMKKPTILRESYTQYIKRAKPSTQVATPSAKLTNWALVGKTEKGLPLYLQIDKATIENRELTIGRDSSSCELVIDDPSVSRKHATIISLAGRLMVSDINSTNGTYIDARKISNQPTAIKVGQKLMIGKVSLILKEA